MSTTASPRACSTPAGQLDDFDGRVAIPQLEDGRGRPVGAAVVDEDDLVRADGAQRRRQTFVERQQVLVLVENGEDGRDRRFRAIVSAVTTEVGRGEHGIELRHRQTREFRSGVAVEPSARQLADGEADGAPARPA